MQSKIVIVCYGVTYRYKLNKGFPSHPFVPAIIT